MPSHLSLYLTFTTTSHHHLVVYTDMSSLLCNEFSIYIPITAIPMISHSYHIPIIVIYSASKSTKILTHGIHPSKLQGNSNRLRASHAWISARWRSTWATEKNIFLGLAIMATVLIMTRCLKNKQWYDMIWYDMIWYDMIWYDMNTCNYNAGKSKHTTVLSLLGVTMLHKLSSRPNSGLEGGDRVGSDHQISWAHKKWGTIVIQLYFRLVVFESLWHLWKSYWTL